MSMTVRLMREGKHKAVQYSQPSMKIAVGLMLLAVTATAQKRSVPNPLQTAQSRIEQQDKQIAELRGDLSAARNQTRETTDTVRANLEGQIQSVSARLFQSQMETAAIREVSAGKDELIQQLQSQIAQGKDHAIDTTKVAIIAEQAATKAARVASTRHAIDSKELKTTSDLAGSAADAARQAAESSERNKHTLDAALGEITRLTGIIEKLARSEIVSRRLMVIVACLTVLVIALIFARLRFSGGK